MHTATASPSPASQSVQPSSTVGALNEVPSRTTQSVVSDHQRTLSIDIVSIAATSEYAASPTAAPEPHLAYTPAPTTASQDALDASATSHTTFILAPQLSPTTSAVVATAAASISGVPVTRLGSAALSASMASATYLSNPNPDVTDDRSVAALTQRSRQSVLLIALLTLGTLGTLGTCLLCLRCKLYSRVRRGFRDSEVPLPMQENALEEGLEKFDSQNEKRSRSPAQQASHIPVDNDIILPILPMQGPPRAHFQATVQPPPPSVSPSGPPPPLHMQLPEALNTEWHFFSTKGEGPFEDVTHILSTDAFVALDGPPASASADSRLSSASTTGSQTSRTPSMSEGASYETCGSRYSSQPATSEEQGSVATSSQSSPNSNFPPTPERNLPSRNPFQDTGENKDGLSNEEIALAVAMQLELESEWDIARAYGSRESAASSVGAAAQLGVNEMETVEVGGKTCILVQGVAR